MERIPKRHARGCPVTPRWSAGVGKTSSMRARPRSAGNVSRREFEPSRGRIAPAFEAKFRPSPGGISPAKFRPSPDQIARSPYQSCETLPPGYQRRDRSGCKPVPPDGSNREVLTLSERPSLLIIADRCRRLTRGSPPARGACELDAWHRRRPPRARSACLPRASTAAGPHDSLR